MSRVSTPVLLALVTLIGLGNVLTTPTVHADGEVAVAELPLDAVLDMPVNLGTNAFMTGPVKAETTLDGLEVRLEREGETGLAAVMHNPTEVALALQRPAEVFITDGNVASRMGPIPMRVSDLELAVQVPPGKTHRHVFSDVAIAKQATEIGELMLSFQTVSVTLGDDQLVLVDTADVASL